MLNISGGQRLSSSNNLEPIVPLNLVLHLNGDSLPNVPGNVSTWDADVGPTFVQDTTLAYGLPTYPAPVVNGHAGVNVNRLVFPRLIAPGIYSEPQDCTILYIYNSATTVATATTRAYILITSQDSVGIEGTRFGVVHNANAFGGNFDNIAFPTDDPFFETPVTNRGWHGFYSELGTPGNNAAGLQIIVQSFGKYPFYMRNGNVIGRGISGSWTRFKRAPSFICTLFCETDADLTATTTYGNYDFYQLMWFTGAANIEQAYNMSCYYGNTFGLTVKANTNILPPYYLKLPLVLPSAA